MKKCLLWVLEAGLWASLTILCLVGLVLLAVPYGVVVLVILTEVFG